ncbi:MAG: beta-N-acetylglucosaminidase [bacterium]|nr:MAG: beta-N-acetylglucosaminidase [bacterium]
MKHNYLQLTVACLLFWMAGITTVTAQKESSTPAFRKDLETHWVDSVFNSLDSNEKIAQLIFVAAYSNRGISHEVAITDLIRKYKIGGLIFFQGTPQKQAMLTNYYQSQSKVPLMIAMDAEWGLAMRLKHTIHFPYQMALGAIGNDSLIYQMGREVGRELKRTGVQMNLAPVVDINSNPDNPVINFRSFGMDKKKVADKGIAYMKGMQDEGILATAKHFPGHGDTGTDSHKTLPVVPFSRERLDTLELYPFQQMIKAGVSAIMTAHLYVPALDSTPHLASSLSKPIVTGILKDSLGFRGLIISDALNMKGVTKYFPPGVVEAKALVAGNDILEFVQDVPLAIKKIKEAVAKGLISWDDINQRCKKVLAAKYWAGLNHWQPIDTINLIRDLNLPSAKILNRKLIRASLTVLRDSNNIIPVRNLSQQRIATLAIGSKTEIPFQKMLANYTRTTNFFWTQGNTVVSDSLLLSRLKPYNLVIVGLTNLSQYPGRNFGITPDMLTFLQKLIASHKTIVTVFGNPFLLNKMPGIEKATGLVLTYEDSPLFQNLAAQLIFGAFGSRGTLPVRLDHFPINHGIFTPSLSRLSYTIPEEEGMNSVYLNKMVDSIAQAGIKAKAYPGSEVLVVRNGAVVFHKSYGYHTYYDREKDENNDLYDFASVTKVMASLPAIMKLYDQGKLKLDVPVDAYWPAFKHSNKNTMTLREILAHQAGLQAWIPYWRKTVKTNGKFKRRIFRYDSSSRFNVPVSPHLFLNKNYRKTMYREIKKSPVSPVKKYLYSGLFFYLAPQIVKNLTGEDFEAFLKKNFYHPLGAYTLTFNPYRHFPLQDIVPTEIDTFFRKVHIHGYVHDEGAAMMGGISGNAGLFGTANDLAKMAQMYLQMGFFGGKQFISDTTMEQFTRYQYPENGNRRGLGFDKPLLGNDTLPENKAYPAKSSSPSSFGHSGYTGTFFWVDPKENLLYIFLSNRVYPTRLNHKIYQLNIRTSIQQVLYDAILKEQE